jgi:hypothetical protein
VRGGAYNSNNASQLASSFSAAFAPSFETNNVGFRLAAPVPEPSTYAMALAGLACGGYSHFRRRRAR